MSYMKNVWNNSLYFLVSYLLLRIEIVAELSDLFPQNIIKYSIYFKNHHFMSNSRILFGSQFKLFTLNTILMHILTNFSRKHFEKTFNSLNFLLFLMHIPEVKKEVLLIAPFIPCIIIKNSNRRLVQNSGLLIISTFCLRV